MLNPYVNCMTMSVFDENYSPKTPYTRFPDVSKVATTVGGVTDNTFLIDVSGNGIDEECVGSFQRENSLFEVDEEAKAADAEEPAQSSFSMFLVLMVCVTAVTGFLMGYDLCIVAVVLGPVRDHFGLCSGSGGDALGDSQPCVMNELFVAILAPGAMVSCQCSRSRPLLCFSLVPLWEDGSRINSVEGQFF